MKKINQLILLSVLMLGLIACSNQKSSEDKQHSNRTPEVSAKNENTTNKDVREKAWGQLKENDKERINGTWKGGKVSKVTLNQEMLSQIKDKSYEGKEVYHIIFPTKDTFEPNVIAVYADSDTFNYIGYALVQ